MKNITLLFVSFFIHCSNLTSQNNEFSTVKGFNALVTHHKVLTIHSSTKYSLESEREVIVYNSKGNNEINTYLYYDNNTNIKLLEVKIYDVLGKEIGKYKKSDFNDVSASDGFSLHGDNRIMFLDYKPIQYPYKLVFKSYYESSNTAFLPSWQPIASYGVSVSESSMIVKYAANLGFRYKEYNLGNFKFFKEDTQGVLTFKMENVEPLDSEPLSPSVFQRVPRVRFALDQFSLEGYLGSASNWEELGRWFYHDLYKNQVQLPEKTKEQMKQLTKNATTDKEKARLIYQYMQDKTRYISVQLGIGGFMPTKAEEVDRVGYGDCKALTNYTHALLNAVGVTSYHAIIYNDTQKVSFDPEFSSVQGNHMILYLPLTDEEIWLECTSQKYPFGYIGLGNHDRNALVLTSQGGSLKKTHKYEAPYNLQEGDIYVSLSEDGMAEAEVSIKSGGLQYQQL